MLNDLGGIDRLAAAPRDFLRQAGLRQETISALKQPDEELLAADLAWLEQPDHHLLTWDSDRFPAPLRDVPSPPAALFVDGDPETLWQPQIAIVGSRNPTRGGMDNAEAFTTELVRRGFTITSGMASGIDSCAHRAALAAGGATVAVLGTGVDRVYPASGRPLAEQIRRQGALVSELPLGEPPRRAHFPSRNRIISGLGLAVLVVEAGLNSGTLITARMAGEQGRDVFAIPGSIHNPMSRGCHRLIREGARLVENVVQIIEEVAPMAGQLAGKLRSELEADRAGKLEPDASEPQLLHDPDYRRLWEFLSHDPKSVDQLIDQSGLTAKAVSAMLLMLELRGMAQAHRGGAWSRK